MQEILQTLPQAEESDAPPAKSGRSLKHNLVSRLLYLENWMYLES
jgi:hypothetical protein